MNDKSTLKDFLKSSFARLVHEIGAFEVLNHKLVPYGLKPHTRSISWIAEQVILQQAKVRSKQLGFDEVIFSQKDTDVFDFIIIKNGENIFVNVKVTNTDGKHNKNDISAAEKLYNFFIQNITGQLWYVVIGIKFKNTLVQFSKEHVYYFSPTLLPEIYVNPKNAKLQAYYDAEPVIRTIQEFLDLLYLASQKKGIRFLKKH